MKTLNINKKLHKKYNGGYALLTEDAIGDISRIKEGELAHIYTNDFIGTAVMGVQSKGVGWIVSDEKLDRIDDEYIEKIIDKAMERRIANKKFDIMNSAEYHSNTDAVRVFNGIGDGFGGITIDYYANNYVVSFYSEGTYKYRNQIFSSLSKYEYTALYEKKRFSETGNYIESDDFVKGEELSPIIVKEYDLQFPLYLNDGAMVGMFLDQREVRRRVTNKYAKNKTVLNTFSYTGAFSLAAALGGASKTTSVDLAKRSLEKTREVFEVNNIDWRDHDIHVMDVFEYFRYANKKNLKFDLVILDPPSYAKSKKYRFSAAKNYSELMQSAIKLTEDKGTIIASTNCANFDMKKFKKFIDEAFKRENKKYRILEQYSLPEDFVISKNYSEADYLKVLIIEIL